MSNQQRPSSEPASVLGASSFVRGRVVGDGDLLVLGTIEGEVTLHGALGIGPGGAIRGEQCEAREVSVEGELVADVTAEGAIVVHPGATVRGRLRAAAFRLHEGASVSADLDAAFDLPPELRLEPLAQQLFLERIFVNGSWLAGRGAGRFIE